MMRVRDVVLGGIGLVVGGALIIGFMLLLQAVVGLAFFAALSLTRALAWVVLPVAAVYIAKPLLSVQETGILKAAGEMYFNFAVSIFGITLFWSAIGLIDQEEVLLGMGLCMALFVPALLFFKVQEWWDDRRSRKTQAGHGA